MTAGFGNASSAGHLVGERAGAAVDVARRQVAALVGGEPTQVIFTSGATEALNLAIVGFVWQRRRERPGARVRIALPPTEHHAVLDTCMGLESEGAAELLWLPVDQRGRLDLDALEAMCTDGTDLMCVMAANNEVGTIHPVEVVCRIAAGTGTPVVCDATQAAGKIPLDAGRWGVAMLAFAAHKMYGPQGVGALIVRGDVRLAPLLRGGGHQGGLRPGTLNVPGIAGFGEACRLRRLEMGKDEPRVARLRDQLQQDLAQRIPDLVVNGDLEQRLAGNLHVSVTGVPNTAVQALLRPYVALSTSSACSSGALGPSHVLRALGLSEPVMEGALRLGLGKFTTEEEIGRAAEHIARAVAIVR
jgi:cysteine desulfurase